ncbi:hypothetical protein [Nocardiopsis lambiniae]|uniref:Uncharacterized protein n=1 Tax=Nocardiopsis lambiniae TaxID=3075539 RepID=A0ABU2M6E6_9ACTN|nr:hypothetical protein [Nocardiopsis sp. DSM 44743]MDT0328195.1 hypothetical protein [Nocardiopsis sp. DSM 44743]
MPDRPPPESTLDLANGVLSTPARGVAPRARAHVVEHTRRRALCRRDPVTADAEGGEETVAAARGVIAFTGP